MSLNEDSVCHPTLDVFITNEVWPVNHFMLPLTILFVYQDYSIPVLFYTSAVIWAYIWESVEVLALATIPDAVGVWATGDAEENPADQLLGDILQALLGVLLWITLLFAGKLVSWNRGYKYHYWNGGQWLWWKRTIIVGMFAATFIPGGVKIHFGDTGTVFHLGALITAVTYPLVIVIAFYWLRTEQEKRIYWYSSDIPFNEKDYMRTFLCWFAVSTAMLTSGLYNWISTYFQVWIHFGVCMIVCIAAILWRGNFRNYFMWSMYYKWIFNAAWNRKQPIRINRYK